MIEDACEALGAEWKGKKAGTIGDVGVFAFYANKQITTGEGGILVTNNQKLYETVCSLRNQGRNIDGEWLEHERIGYNYRMSDLQAAVGLAQMQRLQSILLKREKVAKRYMKLIESYNLSITVPHTLKECTMSWFVFIIILPEHADQQAVIRYLHDNGIQSKQYFPPIHLQPVYREFYSYKPGDYPICEQMSKRTLAIPFHNRLTIEEQTYVIEQLSKAINA